MTEYNNYNLKPYNTFGLDAEASVFIEYSDENQLFDIINKHQLANVSFLHIGGGSNLLFVNKKLGLILHSVIKYIDVIADDADSAMLRVGSGVIFDDLCAYAAENGLWGIENLSYIPGEVGASAVQNIGAYGVEVCDVIERVGAIEIATGEKKVFEKSECGYGYRESIFKGAAKGKYIITYIEIKLSKHASPNLDYSGLRSNFEEGSTPSVKEIRETIIRVRKAKLPEVGEIGSAGSFFKNPVVESSIFERIKKDYANMPHYVLEDGLVKIPAGWLIDQTGMKGFEMNGAGVYEKQALVIVNRGGATGESIVSLSELVQEKVFKQFGINIYPEVEFVY